MDFFTVSTLTGGVLFVLVLISHDRRRIVHVNFIATIVRPRKLTM
jgi:hypothetical protein